jgi:hypothetical protein
MNGINGTKNWSCQDITEQVTCYLDNQMTSEQKRDFLLELKRNPTYKEILDKEKSFRSLIKSRIIRHKAPSSLIESIKEKISLAL